MCQILGITSKTPYIANEILRRFFENSNEHPDGWGLAVCRNHAVSLEKEARQATKSSYLSQRLTSNIACETLLAHIRRASIGSIEYANCHPFVRDDITGRTWTLIHNGTFFHPELISPYLSQQEGTTDSEAVLLYLIDQINRETEQKRLAGGAPALDLSERFRVLEKAVFDLSNDNRLNLLIYDGEVLYAHANFRNTLYETYREGTRFIATKPLTFDQWTPVPLMQLRAYKQGELLLEGKIHGREFFEEGHDMGMIYLSYAAL